MNQFHTIAPFSTKKFPILQLYSSLSIHASKAKLEGYATINMAFYVVFLYSFGLLPTTFLNEEEK